MLEAKDPSLSLVPSPSVGKVLWVLGSVKGRGARRSTGLQTSSFGLPPRDCSTSGFQLSRTEVMLSWTRLSSFKILVHLGILCFCFTFAKITELLQALLLVKLTPQLPSPGWKCWISLAWRGKEVCLLNPPRTEELALGCCKGNVGVKISKKE